MSRYTRSGKANAPVAGHGIDRLPVLVEPNVRELMPAGVRTVARVEVQEFHDQDGKLIDRRVTVLADCGHSKQIGMYLDAPLPDKGETTRCLPCSVTSGRN